jgi:hypothetical protein
VITESSVVKPLLANAQAIGGKPRDSAGQKEMLVLIDMSLMNDLIHEKQYIQNLEFFDILI